MEEKKTTPQTPLEKEYQLIEREYRRDVAVLEARPVVEQGFFVLWGMLDAVLLVVFVLAVPTYIVSGSFIDAERAAGILSNSGVTHALTLARAPLPLELGSARALSGDADTTDFLADVENPNTDWYLTFTYSFAYDGGSTESMEGFLNPGESRPLVALHEESEGLSRNPRLVLENLSWQRVNRHEISDPQSYLEERNDFPITNLVTTVDIAVGDEAIGRTDFTVANRTAYSYWEPLFLIVLTRGGLPVSVTQTSIPQFLSGEERTVSVRWFEPIPSGATVRIIPVVNFFDEDVYMRPVEE